MPNGIAACLVIDAGYRCGKWQAKKNRRLHRRSTGDVKNNRESNSRIDPTTPSWRDKIKANLKLRKKGQGILARLHAGK
jgi:hypothetical protein